MSVTLVSPVLPKVPAHHNPTSESATLEYHLTGVLRTMNIELTPTSMKFLKDKVRKAHKYFYGNSNITDWRLRQMSTSDIIIMCHEYSQILKSN